MRFKIFLDKGPAMILSSLVSVGEIFENTDRYSEQGKREENRIITMCSSKNVCLNSQHSDKEGVDG